MLEIALVVLILFGAMGNFMADRRLSETMHDGHPANEHPVVQAVAWELGCLGIAIWIGLGIALLTVLSGGV